MKKSQIAEWKSSVAWQTEEQARDYHARVYGEQPIIWAKNDIEVELVLRICRPGDKVLDLGTGTGRFARPLHQHGCIVTGMDNSLAMLEVCRKAALEDGICESGRTLELKHCDIFEGIPAEASTYDRVVAITVVRHFPEWRYVLGEMLRVCKPGGKIIFDTCNGDMVHRANRLAGKVRWGVHAEGANKHHYEAEIPLRELSDFLAHAGAPVESVEPYDVFNNNYYLEQLLGQRYHTMKEEWGRRLMVPEVRDFWRFLGVELLPHITNLEATYNLLITAKKLEANPVRPPLQFSDTGSVKRRFLSSVARVIDKSRKILAGATAK
jgi:ubiquinone/menaquinone biosynthesis C-methylase UbiE